MTTLVLIALLVSLIGLAIFGIIAESRISELKRERDELKHELATCEYHLNQRNELAHRRQLKIIELNQENIDLTAKLQNSYYRDKKGRIRKYQEL
jgi:hypothetical protein